MINPSEECARTRIRQRNELHAQLPTDTQSIVFAGDSQIEYFPLAQLFDNTHIRNKGVAGEKTRNTLFRIGCICEGTPAKIFLQVGINDIQRNITPERILHNYQCIVEHIRAASPASQIYIHALFPTTGDYRQHNEAICYFNSLLKAFCDDHSIAFIDLHPLLCHQQELNPDYSEDGLHLNSKGYLIWKENLDMFTAC
jgi:hypothetical protein